MPFIDIQQYLSFGIVRLQISNYTAVTRHSAFWCHLCNPYTWCPKYMGTFWFLLRKILHQSRHHRQLHCLCLPLWTFLFKKLALGLVIQDSDNQESLLLRWSLLAAAIARIAKFVAYLYETVPFQYVPHYQLMFTCLNFLPCCSDNSHYLIDSQKSICRKAKLVLPVLVPPVTNNTITFYKLKQNSFNCSADLSFDQLLSLFYKDAIQVYFWFEYDADFNVLYLLNFILYSTGVRLELF